MTPSRTTRVRNGPGVRLVTRAAEDQLHVVRTSQIKILTKHLLEEDSTVHRSIHDLCEGKLDLADGGLITITSPLFSHVNGQGRQSCHLRKNVRMRTGVKLLASCCICLGLSRLKIPLANCS